MKYVDVVSASDVVVMKTGYGIVSETLLHDRPCLYVERPGWREHEELARALEENTTAAFIPFEEVAKGGERLFQCATKVINQHTQGRRSIQTNQEEDGKEDGKEEGKRRESKQCGRGKALSLDGNEKCARMIVEFTRQGGDIESLGNISEK